MRKKIYSFFSLIIIIPSIVFLMLGAGSTDKLTIVVAIGTIISAIASGIMSYSALRTSRFEAIKEYFLYGDTQEMIACRRKMYEYENGEIEFDKDAASYLCSYFHFWGMMVAKGYLPIWVFESASGQSIVRLYAIMEHYIIEKRQVNNKYAYYFEYLVKIIKKKYKYQYHFKLKDDSNHIEQKK